MSEHLESITLPNNSLWLQRLRWFFAELIVVVAGILLALGLQSWWQGRENDVRGISYQRQVLADAKQTRASYQKPLLPMPNCEM